MKKEHPKIQVYNKDYPIMEYINPKWRESPEINK